MKYFRFVAVSITATCFFFQAQRAEASCGLHVCPLPVAVNRDAFPSQLWFEPMYTAYDIGGKGSFVQTNIAGVYEHRLFRAGAVLPIVYLNTPAGEKTAGLANALPFGEFFLMNSSDWKISVGSQLEIPVANADKGFGGEHLMAMPYLNVWKTMQDFRFAVQLGYLQSLSHGAHSHVTYVNPHSDSEFASRVMASYTWLNIWTTESNLSLRQVVDHHATGDKTFIDVGLIQRVQVNRDWALRGGVNIPIASTQRYLLQAFLGIYYYF